MIFGNDPWLVAVRALSFLGSKKLQSQCFVCFKVFFIVVLTFARKQCIHKICVAAIRNIVSKLLPEQIYVRLRLLFYFLRECCRSKSVRKRSRALWEMTRAFENALRDDKSGWERLTKLAESAFGDDESGRERSCMQECSLNKLRALLEMTRAIKSVPARALLN